MGQSYGRNTPLPNVPTPVQALVDTNSAVPVAGGITIDWATVAAVGVDTVTSPAENLTVKAGQKFLRYGQVLTKITASGKYGPFDPAAADGRQTLGRGNVCVLNETVLETGILGFTNRQTNHPLVFVGGRVAKARLLATTGAASLAAGPTFAGLEPVLPQLQYAQF